MYSIQSLGIETRDETGLLTGTADYRGSAAYLSYAFSAGVSSIGFTVKGLQEKIADVSYYGGGLDVGIQTELFPFLRAGFVIQDIGTGLKTISKQPGISNEYDFGRPELRLSVAFCFTHIRL